jgi:hypothetical protein
MNSKKNNIHGIISLILFFITLGIGVASIVIYSVFIGFISFFTILIALIMVSILYFSKCKCRDNCNHVIIGKISVLLSKYKPGNYKSNDLVFGIIIPMFIAIALTQYWLLKTPMLFIFYWVVFVLAIVEIYFFVCNNCLNKKCSMCRHKSLKQV